MGCITFRADLFLAGVRYTYAFLSVSHGGEDLNMLFPFTAVRLSISNPQISDLGLETSTLLGFNYAMSTYGQNAKCVFYLSQYEIGCATISSSLAKKNLKRGGNVDKVTVFLRNLWAKG